MLKSKKLLAILTITLNLVGCSSMSNIERADTTESYFDKTFYGGKLVYKYPNKFDGMTYRIFHQASSGFVSVASIKQSAEMRSNKFCKDIIGDNGKMFTITETESSPFPFKPGNLPKIEIVFGCVKSQQQEQSTSLNTSSNKYTRLKGLKELLDEKIITQDEFNTEKQKILN